MAYDYRLGTNQLSGDIPTELGKLDQISYYFELRTNDLCNDIPTEVSKIECLCRLPHVHSLSLSIARAWARHSWFPSRPRATRDKTDSRCLHSHHDSPPYLPLARLDRDGL